MTEALPKKKKIHCGDRQHSYVTKHIQEALALPNWSKLSVSNKNKSDCMIYNEDRTENCWWECDRASHTTAWYASRCHTNQFLLASQVTRFCRYWLWQNELPVDIILLIGSDHYWKIITCKVAQRESGPTALETHLGWIFSGPTCGPDGYTSAVNVITSQCNHTLKQFWDLESLDINATEVGTLENFDDSAWWSIRSLPSWQLRT